MRLLLSSLIVSIFLIGCGTTIQKKEVIITPSYSDSIPYPEIEPLDIKEVEFEIRKKEDEFEYVLSEEQNSFLIHNLEEMSRYIKTMNANLKYLKGIFESRKTNDNLTK